MLERPPTWEETWRARLNAGAAATVAFFVLLWVQVEVLRQNFWAGAGLAPLWNFAAFQLISRVTTGRTFGLRFDPRARTPDEVWDVLFTVAFSLCLAAGLFMIHDAWVFRAPALPS